MFNLKMKASRAPRASRRRVSNRADCESVSRNAGQQLGQDYWANPSATSRRDEEARRRGSGDCQHGFGLLVEGLPKGELGRVLSRLGSLPRLGRLRVPGVGFFGLPRCVVAQGQGI